MCVPAQVRGRDGKTLKCQQSVCALHQVLVRVCLYVTLQLQRSTAVWKLLANVSSQPLSLSLSVFLPVYASFCKCLKYMLCQKKQQKRFQSSRLKGINSSVSLLNCFKESACTDAIIHEGWRNHLCVIELLFERLSESLK